MRLTIVFLLFGSILYAQIPEFDKMEMLYEQQHYKMVYRRANRLLDKPEFDYSLVPGFYKSISTLQLASNEYWLLRHPDVLEEAKNLFLDIKSASDGKKVLDAHMHELSSLKKDLYARLEDYKRQKDQEKFQQLEDLIVVIFEELKTVDFEEEEQIAIVEDTDAKDERDAIVQFAKKQLGVPYVWAGDDPSGFDCSGFTSYVMKKFEKELPRRAVDQYEASQKVKNRNVAKGDLVFFDNGSGISHVGIIVSESGEPLTMIHASSSKGIVVTNIDTSDYWKARLKGFGTYVN